MNNTVLLQKLIAIERSIGTVDNRTLRQLVYEAEDCLLEIQKESAQSFTLDSSRGAQWRKVSIEHDPRLAGALVIRVHDLVQSVDGVGHEQCKAAGPAPGSLGNGIK